MYLAAHEPSTLILILPLTIFCLLQVFGVEWNPFEVSHEMPHQFLTFGKKHIRMWNHSPEAGNGAIYTDSLLAMSKFTMQNVTAAQWLPPDADDDDEGLVAAGMANGQVYLFRCDHSIFLLESVPAILFCLLR